METVEELKTKGNTALQDGDVSGAVKLYSEALKEVDKLTKTQDISMAKAAIFSNRCAAHSKANDYARALKDAEEAIKLAPLWSKGYSRKGACLAYLGQYKDALEAYKAGLKLDPDNASIKSGIADVENMIKGQQERSVPNPFAKPGVRQKLKTDPKTKDLFNDPSFVLMMDELERNPSSLAKFLNDPRVMKCLSVLLGIDFDSAGDEDEDHPAPAAANGSHKTNNASKSNADATAKPEKMETDEAPHQIEAKAEKERGNECYKRKDFENALQHYEKAIQLDPTDITYLLNKAAVYFEMGSFTECQKICEQAVEVGRENRADYKLLAKAFSRIGNIHYKQKDLRTALTWYNKSLSEFRDPEIVKRAQEIGKVIKEEDKKSYINPELAEVEKQKGNEYFAKGDYPEAVKYYNEAIRRNPTDPKLYSNRSACYTKLMEFHLALKDAEDCISLDPNFVKGYLRKGASLVALKDMSKAAQAFRKATEIDPNCQEAIESYRKCMMAEDDPEVVKQRAMADPEVKRILEDPAMHMILQQMQSDPNAIRDHLKNPEIAAKIQKLIEVGVLAFR